MRRVILFPILSVVAASLIVGLLWGGHEAQASHYDWNGATWRTQWEECVLVFFSCTEQTMNIEFRRGSSFTNLQRARILDGVSLINTLSTDDHLKIADVGTTNQVFVSCDASRDPDWGYNRNSVYWDGQAPSQNSLAVTHWNTINNGEEMCNFRVRYFDSPSGKSYNYSYTGTSDDEIHWLPVVTHEFGHAIGFGVEADRLHFSGAHCPNDPARREIMCSGLVGEYDYTDYGNSDKIVLEHSYSD